MGDSKGDHRNWAQQIQAFRSPSSPSFVFPHSWDFRPDFLAERVSRDSADRLSASMDSESLYLGVHLDGYQIIEGEVARRTRPLPTRLDPALERAPAGNPAQLGNIGTSEGGLAVDINQILEGGAEMSNCLACRKIPGGIMDCLYPPVHRPVAIEPCSSSARLPIV